MWLTPRTSDVKGALRRLAQGTPSAAYPQDDLRSTVKACLVPFRTGLVPSASCGRSLRKAAAAERCQQSTPAIPASARWWRQPVCQRCRRLNCTFPVRGDRTAVGVWSLPLSLGRWAVSVRPHSRSPTAHAPRRRTRPQPQAHNPIVAPRLLGGTTGVMAFMGWQQGARGAGRSRWTRRRRGGSGGGECWRGEQRAASGEMGERRRGCGGGAVAGMKSVMAFMRAG